MSSASAATASAYPPVGRDRRRIRSSLATTLLGCLLATAAPADGWIDAGDARVRNDLQRLFDAGYLRGPSMSWPIAWSEVRRDLDAIDVAQLPPGAHAAVERLRALAARETEPDVIRVDASLALAAQPYALRTFEYTPREEAEAGVAADWQGERFSWRARATLVADPDDDRPLRPDGSYVATKLGNWVASAGYLERWWGPGWDGSLILSTNARPVPALALDRLQSVPSDLPLLRWLGPWRLSTFMGQLESDRDYSGTLLWGLRGEIRPHPTLQLAVSRTAQWCGDGRPCGLDTFWDLLSGNDNDQPTAEQPGNQLAGFDVRWSWPGARVPVALYAQGIGEDEASSLPSKYLGLFGLETWGESRLGAWRAHVEYADTACDFPTSPPQFGCAYTNTVYTTGYRYRGRALGHTVDADGENVGYGLMLVEAGGNQWTLLGRNVKLNREGLAVGHTLSDSPARVVDVSLAHGRSTPWGTIDVLVGYADVTGTGDVHVDEGVRAALQWRSPLR